MPQTVRVAFIGCGSLANRMHYPSLAEMDDVELVACCDLDEAKLGTTAERFGIPRRFTDYNRMLREVDCEAVYAIMPSLEPFPNIVVECIGAGKHVFLEKPPGVTLAACERMAEAAAARGVKTMVGFNRRFAPVVEESRRRVAESGGVSQMMAEFHKDMLTTGPYWGVSILTTDVIHVVDLLRHVCGEPVEVASFPEKRFADWTNVYSALVAFDSGATGILSANRAAGSRYERFEIHGRGISAYVRAPEEARVWREGQREPEVLRGEVLAASADPRRSYGYFAESRHFVDCILADRRPLTDLSDALKTMQLVAAIESGRG
ncbi:MAG TPA: Gfo/Idh/MocA family oxidoreductase [Chloroflexota bacterium]